MHDNFKVHDIVVENLWLLLLLYIFKFQMDQGVSWFHDNVFAFFFKILVQGSIIYTLNILQLDRNFLLYR